MDIDEPNWQEMDKAIETIDLAFENIGLLSDFVTREQMENLYLKLRKLALNHARISN